MSYVYEDSTKLVTRVNQQLRSYQEAGMIDPVRFAHLLRAALHDIGLDAGTRQETQVFIQNGKARLPVGLSKLEQVLYETPDYTQHIKPYMHAKGGYQVDASYIYLPAEENTRLTLLYIGDTEASELPFVPLDPIIQTYLEKKLIHELIREWYLNSDDPNLERKLQLVTQELEIAYRSALHAVKLPTPEALHNYRNRTRRRIF